MAKVTSKLQVTVPKALAAEFGVSPGDEIEWQSAGDSIRLVPRPVNEPRSIDQRLQLFDLATERVKRRSRGRGKPTGSGSRGWTREELYERGSG